MSNTYYLVSEEPDSEGRYSVLCDYHGDRNFTQAFGNRTWDYGEAWDIALKLNDVLKLGASQKAAQIRHVLEFIR